MDATTQGQLAGLLGGAAVLAAMDAPVQTIAADGAIPVVSGNYLVTKGSAAALTIAAPAAADVGKVIQITSNTAFAHAITFTGNTLCCGTAAVATATCAAQKGAGVVLACRIVGFWHVVASVGQTFA